MEIAEALKKLDPSDDSQWTSDGLPKLDTVRELAGDATMTRKDITAAAPEFMRDKVDIVVFDYQPDDKTIKEAKLAEVVEDKPPEDIKDKPPSEVEMAIASDEGQQVILSGLIVKPSADDRKKEIDERINDLNQQKGVIELEVDALLREQTRLQTSQFVDNSAAADTKARLYYIAQQNRIRAEKAKRGRAFLESGANIADINPKSALDQAFSRSTKRGTARPPVRALKTE